MSRLGEDPTTSFKRVVAGSGNKDKWNILNRELIQSKGRPIPSLPILAIRGHICFRCFSPSDKLTKCGACLRAVYCGKDCQTRDWKLQHKKDCKVLKKINEAEREETYAAVSRDEWTQGLRTKVQLVQQMTKDQTPLDIIQCQPFCSVCHRGSMQLPPGTNLVPCPTCHLEFTCTGCTSTHTPDECKKYQVVGSIDFFRIAHFNTTGQVWCQAPTEKPRSTYRALASVKNWYEYFSEISDKSEAIDRLIRPDDSFTIDEDILSLADLETQAAIQRMWLFLLISTDTQTMPLTVLSALEDTGKDLATCQTLTLHLIGAGDKEIQNSIVFEELFHLLPSLQTLKIALFGPRCSNKDAPKDDPVHELKMDCCPVCTARGRKRTLALYHGLYHDYAKFSQYQKPDLAVLFHSGRPQAEIESWDPTTKFLVDSSTPTVCTTYTEREATEEISQLKDLDAKFIKPAEVNRWKSLVPIPEPLEGQGNIFYHHNYYRYIFQGRN